jgi:hypothetical protein
MRGIKINEISKEKRVSNDTLTTNEIVDVLEDSSLINENDIYDICGCLFDGKIDSVKQYHVLGIDIAACGETSSFRFSLEFSLYDEDYEPKIYCCIDRRDGSSITCQLTGNAGYMISSYFFYYLQPYVERHTNYKKGCLSFLHKIFKKQKEKNQ